MKKIAIIAVAIFVLLFVSCSKHTVTPVLAPKAPVMHPVVE